MKKFITILCVLGLTLSVVGCSKSNDLGGETEQKQPVIEAFDTEYEVNGTSHSGQPKTDLFIFKGETTDGIITKLDFDIISNVGTENEISRKDMMGYLMNTSDAKVEKTENGYTLTQFSANGFNDELQQFMIKGSVENLTDETTFKDVTFTSFMPISLEQALSAYSSLAKEAGVELTEDTKLVELLPLYGLYADGAFVEGFKRVAFEGPNGGRSYGEQIDAITSYILANNMTLEDVYELFKNENKLTDPMSERDTISGATIAFGGDFERMAYQTAFGEIFEGVTGETGNEDGTKTLTVSTQGFAGEVLTNITYDAEGKIVSISASGSETDTVGALLYAEGSEFLAGLVEGKTDVSTGATMTSNALIKAVTLANEYVSSAE